MFPFASYAYVAPVIPSCTVPETLGTSAAPRPRVPFLMATASGIVQNANPAQSGRLHRNTSMATHMGGVAMQRLARWFFALALVFVLGACGGGGGGAPAETGDGGEVIGDSADAGTGDEGTQQPTQVTEFPFRAAVEKLATVPHVYSLNGTGSDGQEYALTFWSTPGPDTVFPEATFKTFTVNEVISTPAGGTISSVTEFLYQDPFVIGLVVLDGDWVTGSTTFVVPRTATVGSSSVLFENATVYDRDFLLRPTKGTAELTWRFGRHSPTTAWMCLKFTRTVLGDTASNDYCFVIDENGDASALRLTVNSGGPGGFTVEFQ